MPAQRKNKVAYEAAYGLYIMGIEVANADGKIDEKEIREILNQGKHAASLSKSVLVQEAGRLLAQFDELKAYQEKDSRDHVSVLRALKKLLDEQPESDRMRYLAWFLSVGKGVAEASGGGWFSSGSASDEEAVAVVVCYRLVAGTLDVDTINAWTNKHGG
jgi:hypothetical protein